MLVERSVDENEANAYRLVYVRESDRDEILGGVAQQNFIPASLSSFFEQEASL